MHGRPSGFMLVELDNILTDNDMDDLVEVTESALAEEPMFQLRIKDLPPGQRKPWIRTFWLRGALPEAIYRSYVIRELSSGKLVGWTRLQFPVVLTDAEKEQNAQTRADMTDALGYEGQAFLRMFDTRAKEMMSKCGYDPEQHFHKRNTLIHSEYQTLGLGTWLTEHCNDVADRAQRSTFVMARPKAWRMFERTGFQYLDQMSVDISAFGVDEPADIRYFRRDPTSI